MVSAYTGVLLNDPSLLYILRQKYAKTVNYSEYPREICKVFPEYRQAMMMHNSANGNFSLAE